MKLALTFLSLSLLALAAGCASQQAKPVVVEQSSTMDTTDPSFTPPDESGVSVDEKKIDTSARDSSKKGKSEGKPMHVGLPGHSGHSGSVHSAK